MSYLWNKYLHLLSLYKSYELGKSKLQMIRLFNITDFPFEGKSEFGFQIIYPKFTDVLI